MVSGAQQLRASLYAIRVGDIWAFMKRQPLSFWCINLYMFFEYVRPQQIYSEIDLLPWAWGFIWLAAAAFIFEGFKGRRLYPADKVLALFTAMVLLSSVMAIDPTDSLERLRSTFRGF